jgi:propanol-preferring alcohol dehydrogenase
MRAFQLLAPRRAELRVVDEPEPRPSEVLLKVAAAGVCHSDLHLLHAPALPYELPMTLGHEVAGHVARIGADVDGWDVGQPAIVYLCWGCGRCTNCISGAENYCLAHPKDSVPGAGLGRHGGMADYIVVPSRQLLPLGDLDPVGAAPLADAALTPYHAIAGARALLRPGSTVVVIGVGGLGNLAVQIVVATTASRVIAVDTDESRLAMASARGATNTLLAGSTTAADVVRLTGGLGADLVLDLVGSEVTLRTAADCVATGGRISILGLAAGRLPVLAGPPPFSMPWGVSVVRPYGGTRRDLLEVLSLARSGHLEVPIETYPLTEAAAVLVRLEEGKVQGRAVLVP